MGVMRISVSNTSGYHELVGWLEEHVGRMLHCQPIIMATGKGWVLERNPRYRTDPHSGHGYVETADRGWTAHFDDEQAGTMFALRWS